MPDSDTDGVIAGRLYRAGSNRFVHAVIRRDADDGFMVLDSDEAVLVSARLRDVSIDRPLPGGAWRIGFPSGMTFEADGRDTFLALMGNASRRRGVAAAGWAALLSAAVAVVVVLWLAFPFVVDGIVKTIPVSVDRAMGEATLEQFDATVFQKTQLPASLRRTITALFDQVRDAAGMPPDRVRLEFRRSEAFGANAIALSDGTVVVLDGLTRQARSQDELAAVLAHELAHIHHRHQFRQMARTIGLSILFFAILGDDIGMTDRIGAFGVDMVGRSFSRDFETEADADAAAILNRMGMDPTALVDLLRRVQENCDGACEETSLFDTHPGLRDRLETVSGGE